MQRLRIQRICPAAVSIFLGIERGGNQLLRHVGEQCIRRRAVLIYENRQIIVVQFVRIKIRLKRIYAVQNRAYRVIAYAIPFNHVRIVVGVQLIYEDCRAVGYRLELYIGNVAVGICIYRTTVAFCRHIAVFYPNGNCKLQFKRIPSADNGKGTVLDSSEGVDAVGNEPVQRVKSVNGQRCGGLYGHVLRSAAIYAGISAHAVLGGRGLPDD